MSLYVDPFMQPLLDQMRAAPVVDYAHMPIDGARRLFEDSAAPWKTDMPDVLVRDLDLSGSAGPIPARLFMPRQEKALPLIVFAHGGGWTFGSIHTHEDTMRRLAVEAGAAVLGFDYRLAPEHPFPAALDDMLAVIAQAEDGVLGESVDVATLMLAGDSAGANIALAALLVRRDRGASVAMAAALFYGCYAPDLTTESYRTLGDGSFGLSSERMRWYWDNYLGSAKEAPPLLAAPLAADFDDLPPLYLAVGSLDPLLDDTLNLSRRLAHQGKAHRCDLVPGVVHGFLRHAQELPAARSTIEAAGAFLASQVS